MKGTLKNHFENESLLLFAIAVSLLTTIIVLDGVFRGNSRGNNLIVSFFYMHFIVDTFLPFLLDS